MKYKNTHIFDVEEAKMDRWPVSPFRGVSKFKQELTEFVKKKDFGIKDIRTVRSKIITKDAPFFEFEFLMKNTDIWLAQNTQPISLKILMLFFKKLYDGRSSDYLILVGLENVFSPYLFLNLYQYACTKKESVYLTKTQWEIISKTQDNVS